MPERFQGGKWPTGWPKEWPRAKWDWSIGVSIPVPRACKARTLPIELMPPKKPKPDALAGN